MNSSKQHLLNCTLPNVFSSTGHKGDGVWLWPWLLTQHLEKHIQAMQLARKTFISRKQFYSKWKDESSTVAERPALSSALLIFSLMTWVMEEGICSLNLLITPCREGRQAQERTGLKFKKVLTICISSLLRKRVVEERPYKILYLATNNQLWNYRLENDCRASWGMGAGDGCSGRNNHSGVGNGSIAVETWEIILPLDSVLIRPHWGNMFCFIYQMLVKLWTIWRELKKENEGDQRCRKHRWGVKQSWRTEP